jgi:predicted N-acetyltransferase YhbS
MFSICPERPCDSKAIEALLDDVFGPGRFARTAYQLREGADPVAGLSFVAICEGKLRGSIRFTQASVGGKPVLFLGPLVVNLEDRGKGVGIDLLKRGLKAAKATGALSVILVGDPPYYGRVGFRPLGRGRVIPFGPIDPDRLLALEFVPGGFDALKGPLTNLRAASPR